MATNSNDQNAGYTNKSGNNTDDKKTGNGFNALNKTQQSYDNQSKSDDTMGNIGGKRDAEEDIDSVSR
ncbi:MAG: hypothetical protein ACK4NC_06450 [Candidatus Gracilibacteria bacterium]